MKTGLGKLGLTPDAFWRMSWVEFNCAVEGLAEFHGAGSPSGGITREEANDILARVEANEQRQKA